jgi:hypothetical protein
MINVNRLWTVVGGGIVATMLVSGCSASQDQMQASPSASATSLAPDGIAAPAPEYGPVEEPQVKRDVVKTATMTVNVADTSAAADKAAVIAENADGRVDRRAEDAGTGRGRAHTSIVLRVPVEKLDGVVRELKELGTVQTAETTSDDVTAQRVDLDARIRALQTSVDRLLGIMRDARDPEALISAENALSQRQAELDSLRAQRDQLGDQIAYSTVDVSFVADQIGGPAPEQYQGFLGQIERGWDGLVGVLGNVVLLFGLLLPWLAALAVVLAVVYVIVRVTRRRARVPAAVPETTTIPDQGRGSSNVERENAEGEN